MDHILNSSENRKRGALKAKETKARKNFRSLEKRPYPILSGFVLSRKRWSRIKRNEWKLLAASSESMHSEWQQWQAFVLWNVTQSLPHLRSFAWITLLLICSSLWILHISNIWEHHANVRTTNTHNIVLYAKIWFPGRKKYWILKNLTHPVCIARLS